MAESQLKCMRCQGNMEAGIVLDRAQQGVVARQTWVDGSPEKSIWFGLKTKDHVMINVVTYRCETCGYLESYTTDAAE